MLGLLGYIHNGSWHLLRLLIIIDGDLHGWT